MLSLKKNVYYLSDLGLVYIDNGSVTIAISSAYLRKALVNKDVAEQVVKQYPALFEQTGVAQAKLEQWMIERCMSY